MQDKSGSEATQQVLTNNKKPKEVKKDASGVVKQLQFIIRREQHQSDYKQLVQAKKLFNQLATNYNLSKPALLLKLVKSFTLNGNYTASDKQLVLAAAEHQGISVQEFNRRNALLIATKINKQQANGKTASVNSNADSRVEQIVAEMIKNNELASSWLDKREITQRSINDWGKHASTKVQYKSISPVVLRRYFMLHRDQIEQHHHKHEIKPDHNRRAVSAIKILAKKANQEQLAKSQGS